VAIIRFDDSDDLIDICLDNVFKAVFTKDTPESRGALSKLLSALIGRELTVLVITANEPDYHAGAFEGGRGRGKAGGGDERS
jgi:hypothetical protein